MRKFLSPPRGLFTENLRDSVDGAHPVLRLESLAGFSHPRNPKIFRVASALIASGKEIFSFDGITSRALKNGREGCGERIGGGFEHMAAKPPVPLFDLWQDLAGLTGGSDGPRLLAGERRGAPGKPALVLAESEAIERTASLPPIPYAVLESREISKC